MFLSNLENTIDILKTYIWSHQTLHGGFPPEEGCREDVLTTAEAIYACLEYGNRTSTAVFDLEKAYKFLLQRQDPIGKWPDQVHSWEVTTTAWSVYVLLYNHKLARSINTMNAINWLVRQQLVCGGFRQNEHVQTVNTYATAYALKSLSLVKNKDDPVVLRGLEWLFCMQGQEGGWGLDDNTYEASLTAYVCHGLASLISRYPKVETALERAANWLESMQREDGSWGVFYSPDQSSIEGTAFTLYALMVIKRGIQQEKVKKGIDFLLRKLPPYEKIDIPLWTCLSVLHALETWHHMFLNSTM